MAGWRLAVVALGLFLGPLVVAITGAILLGPSPAGQLAGAFAGLGLGGAGAAAALRRLAGTEQTGTGIEEKDEEEASRPRVDEEEKR